MFVSSLIYCLTLIIVSASLKLRAGHPFELNARSRIQFRILLLDHIHSATQSTNGHASGHANAQANGHTNGNANGTVSSFAKPAVMSFKDKRPRYNESTFLQLFFSLQAVGTLLIALVLIWTLKLLRCLRMDRSWRTIQLASNLDGAGHDLFGRQFVADLSLHARAA
ncbi:hypothetical protein L1887_58793 [Cichorium endivia]|nr:hypothetical protein L1887_58793 [Cichorium endivia]